MFIPIYYIHIPYHILLILTDLYVYANKKPLCDFHGLINPQLIHGSDSVKRIVVSKVLQILYSKDIAWLLVYLIPCSIPSNLLWTIWFTYLVTSVFVRECPFECAPIIIIIFWKSRSFHSPASFHDRHRVNNIITICSNNSMFWWRKDHTTEHRGENSGGSKDPAVNYYQII